MQRKQKQVCSECSRKLERCRPVTVNLDGSLTYVCRSCWRELDFDKFMYKHLEEQHA